MNYMNQKKNIRTLVEAATEGLLMLIDGKVSFSNTVISKMTGYNIAELSDLSLSDLISKSNNKDIIETFSRDTIKEGQFELNLRTKSGGLIDVLVTSSTAVFYGKNVNILIVKDISVDKTLKFTSLDYQKLIGTLNIGFFKVKIDSKGKFLFANETALRILGFKSFRELSEIHITDLIAEPVERKNLFRELIKNGFVKSKILRINKRSGENFIVSLSMVVIKSEKNMNLFCDGIIEDITSIENEKIKTETLIAELKVKDLILERPVKSFLSPFYTMDADSTLSEAIQLMTRLKTDNLLLTKSEKDIIGIITSTDIQNRIFALNLRLDNPSYLIMSSPVKYISENTIVIDAVRFCREYRINHIGIKNGSNEITGIFKLNDVHNSLINAVSFYISDVLIAENKFELSQCYSQFQKLLTPVIKTEIAINVITAITTLFSDSAIRRIIELTVNEIGQSPVSFAFICLGSEGRKEETIFTDQDNAIIYEDVPKEIELSVNEYFMKLGAKVCNTLDTMGYSFCKGNIMAKNPQWCKPLSTWETYFKNWIATPDPQNLLDASIFFDFRTVYGDEIFTEKLKNTISDTIKDNSLFLYHLAYNTFNIKPQHISSGNILSDKGSDSIDLKSAVGPLIMFARTYSLQNSIWHSNTLERLTALKEKSVINETTADEIIFTYNFLMKLRFRNQVELSEANLPISNIMNTKKMIDPELFLLKKVLSTIPDYQNKIKSDFKITT